MRVRLVARLLAVMLASPVVAFTSPGEGLTKAPASPAAGSLAPAELGPPAPEVIVAAPATTMKDARVVPRERLAEPPRSGAAADGDRALPTEVRISVDCGHDGCVVQEGLAVLVVGDAG